MRHTIFLKNIKKGSEKMFKLKIILPLCIVLICVTACDIVKTEKDELLFNTVTDIQTQVENREWDSALTNINQLENLYEQRKWKLQLLGELEDYKEVELEIISLKEIIKAQDDLEANITLSNILHRLELIFDL